MEILVAKSAGFCFGVEKAIESVYKEIETGKKKNDIYFWTDNS